MTKRQQQIWFLGLCCLILSLWVGCDRLQIPEHVEEHYTKVKTLYKTSFELGQGRTLELLDSTIAHKGRYSCRLTKEEQYGTTFTGTAKELGIVSGDRVEVNLWTYKLPEHPRLDTVGAVVLVQIRDEEAVYWQGFDFGRYMSQTGHSMIGNWESHKQRSVLEDVQPDDKISIFVWNPNGEPFYYDDLAVTLWRKDAAIKQDTIKNYRPVGLVYENSYENPTNQALGFEGEYAYELTDSNESTKGVDLLLSDLGLKAADKLKVRFAAQYAHTDSKVMLVYSLQTDTTKYDFSRKGEGWQTYEQIIDIPEHVKPYDRLLLYLERPSQDTGVVWVDDFSISLWRKVVHWGEPTEIEISESQKREPKEERQKANPDPEGRLHALLYNNKFEETAPNHSNRVAYKGEQAFRLTPELEYGNVTKFLTGQLGLKRGDGIFIRFKLFKEAMDNQVDQFGSLVIAQTRGDETVYWKGLDLAKALGERADTVLGHWVDFRHFVTLDDVEPKDQIEIFFWNRSNEPVYYDNLHVTAWRSDANPACKGSEQAAQLNFENDYILTSETQYSQAIKQHIDSLGLRKGQRVEVRGRARRLGKYSGAAAQLVLSVERAGNTFFWQSRSIEPMLFDPKTFLDSEANLSTALDFSHCFELPQDLQPNDLLSVYVWRSPNPQAQPIGLDFLEVWR